MVSNPMIDKVRFLNIPAILVTILVASVAGKFRSEIFYFSQYSEQKIGFWSRWKEKNIFA